MRLLLVDDDRGLRTLLRTTFEVFDIEVDEADSASVALKRVASHRPDVVVLDVHMPGMSGLELLRKLKTDEDTAGIGVVLLTGSTPTPRRMPKRPAPTPSFASRSAHSSCSRSRNGSPAVSTAFPSARRRRARMSS